MIHKIFSIYTMELRKNRIRFFVSQSIFFLLLFFLFPSSLPAQPTLSSVSNTFQALIHSTDEAHRLLYSDKFTKEVIEIVKNDSKFNFPFDSIANLRSFVAKDKSFRIINWVILKDEGLVTHKAIFQIFNKNEKKYEIVELQDLSAQCENPEQFVGDAEHWFGALYSQLVETQYNDKTYYTLLGWNGSDALCNRKVIESLYIKSNGDLVFGSPLFKMGKTLQKRVIFRLGKMYDMILRYDYQSYPKKIASKKKGVAPSLHSIPANLIVFDRLVPLKSHLQNEFSFYLPIGGIYDAFFFEQGKWNLKLDVDAHNSNPPLPAKKRSEKPKLYESTH
ncbi:MAG: hypothetical protein RR190_07075 [Bacteroidales bacterium]